MQLHTKKCWIFLKCLSQKKNIITQKGKEDWFGESDAFWCFLAHVFYFALYSFPMISSDANEKTNLAGWMELLCKPTGSTGYGWNLLCRSVLFQIHLDIYSIEGRVSFEHSWINFFHISAYDTLILHFFHHVMVQYSVCVLFELVDVWIPWQNFKKV